MMIKRSMLGLLAIPTLAACTTPVDQPPYTDAAFGEAVYRNMAVQMVNPPPAEVGDLPPAEGNRRALMMLRYQTDTVEEPVEESTQGDE